MMQWSLFYRLLGIPDDIDEPSYYQLLGIDPADCTAERVDRALTDRKKYLRQNIPGPGFIPLVLTFEVEQLDTAAGVLGDPQQRRNYDRQLARKNELISSGRMEAVRKDIVRQARALIAEAVDQDGTLEADSRFSLAQQLSRLNIKDNEIRLILSRIPLPTDRKQKSRKATRPDSSEITFFSQAVEFAIVDGVLYDEDDKRLRSLAAHLDISPMVAESIINRQLVENEASKSGGSADKKNPWLEPMGWKSPSQRRQATPPASGKAMKIIGITFLVVVLTGFFVALTWIGMSEKEFARMEEELTLPLSIPSLEVAPPESPVVSTGVVDKPQVTDADELLIRLMEISGDRNALERLLVQSDKDVLKQALKTAALSMRSDSDPAQTASIISLFRLLLRGHFAAGFQDMAVESLLAACVEATIADDIKRTAMLLAEVLFLNPSAGVVLTTSDRRQFVEMCQTAWLKSRQQQPGDPVFDPKRLAEMIATQGSLDLYFPFTDKAHFTRVTRQLAKLALDVQPPVSPSALKILFDLAEPDEGRPDYGPDVVRAALCDVLAETEDPGLAERVFLSLARFVRIHDIPELVSSDFGSATFRKRAGVILKSYFETGSIPDQYHARRFPLFTSIQVKDAAGNDFRSHYSDSQRVQDVLTDVGITLLACCERANDFTGGEGNWSEQLVRILSSTSIAAEMTRRFVVSYEPDNSVRFESAGEEVRAYSAAAMLGSDQLATIQQELEGEDLALRYRAIEQLQNMNTSQSADLLLALLRSETIVGHVGSVGRVIRSLRMMDDPDIIPRLIDIVADGDSRISYLIVRALILETQITPAEEGFLPEVHDDFQRQACADWWKRQWSRGGLSWSQHQAYPPLVSYPAKRPSTSQFTGVQKPNVSASPPASAVGSAATWQPDQLTLKVSATMVYYAKVLADQLGGFEWDGQADRSNVPKADESAVYAEAVDIGPELLAALGRVNDQLARLIRTHPQGKDYALETDILFLQDTARFLACDTIWQQVVTRMDTQGQLLAILLRLIHPSDEQVHALDQITYRRSQLVNVSPDVFYELREHTYYNLVYWDMLNALAKK